MDHTAALVRTHSHYKQGGNPKIGRGDSGRARVNQQIRAREVRLISNDGEHLGVVPLREALSKAQQQDLDLVEISPTADPPVVRVMDYGKYIYEQDKKRREARRAQKQTEIKEIRLRPKTSDHHRNIRINQARGWLEDGMKVKVRVRFRGREITYPELGREQLEEVAEQLSDMAEVEHRPNMEGRTMLMILAPKK